MGYNKTRTKSASSTGLIHVTPPARRDFPHSLPREAREGLRRVWLEILKERHPDVCWVSVSDSPNRALSSRPPIETAAASISPAVRDNAWLGGADDGLGAGSAGILKGRSAA